MSLELNADNSNEFSLTQQQIENILKTTEENKHTEQIQTNDSFPSHSGLNSTFKSQNESKEKEAKSLYEKKESYEDEM